MVSKIRPSPPWAAALGPLGRQLLHWKGWGPHKPDAGRVMTAPYLMLISTLEDSCPQESGLCIYRRCNILGTPRYLPQVCAGALSQPQFRELILVKAANEVQTLELLFQLH